MSHSMLIMPTEPDDSLTLRRAIARSPGDLALRSAWAELAERRGEHDRARLVREQLTRRTTQMSIPGYRAFVGAAETKLLQAHPEWTEELAPLGVSQGTLSGGFVESIVVDAATLLSNGAAILESAPIRAIRLTGDLRLLPRLVEARLLERVCRLDVSGLKIDGEVLAMLANLPELRALGLACCGLGDAEVELLWRSFPRLLACDLDGNGCRDLVTKELTYQEMSSWEWFATERAMELEAKYGARSWIRPSPSPSEDPIDLEQLLSRIANGW